MAQNHYPAILRKEINMLTVARKKEHLFTEDLQVAASYRKINLIYSYTVKIIRIFVNYF